MNIFLWIIRLILASMGTFCLGWSIGEYITTHETSVFFLLLSITFLLWAIWLSLEEIANKVKP